MRTNLFRLATLAALVVATVAGVGAAHAGDRPDRPSLAELARLAYAQCRPGGATAADTAVANQVRPNMNGRRLGRSVNAYTVSCARTIVETTAGRGLAQRAAVIAVTTAITESSLHNYTEAVDHDSLGLFQQRPSQGWGTPAQIVDPVYATNAFLNAMLRKFPNNSWMSGDIGAICQRVQVSADPGAYAYEVHDAQLLVSALWTGVPNLGVLDYHLSDSVTSPVSTRPVIRYGQSPMVPIVGDWDGDGAETVSVYDPSAGAFLLSDDPATGSHQFLVRYGNPNAAPLVGDWDGDGRDNIGVRMGTTFFLRVSPITSTTETTTTVTFGGAGDIPVIGDWDGDGRDNVGVYVPALARFSLRTSANDAPETVRSLVYGNANVTPLAGDWDGDGRTNIGVRMGHIFFFRTSPITSGTETTVSIGYGNGDGREYPVTGDWDGDGRATQGIVF
jgi:hypothetical protein